MADLEDIGVISGIGNYSPSGGIIVPNSGPYGSIIAGTPEYRYFTAPLSNKGNPTSQFGNNQFVVTPTTPIRLVDYSTGKVAYEGTGYEGALAAIDAAKALTSKGGNKASWDIQIVPPNSNRYSTIANEKFNKSVLGQIADVLGDAALGLLAGGPIGAAIAAGASIAGVNVSDIALPIIVAGIPGIGPVAGAALGSATSSAIQGRSIKETLMRAGITAATAGILEGTGFGNKISDAVSGVMKDIGFQPMIDDVIKSVSSGAITKQMGDEIIVNAIMQQAATATISGGVTSLADAIAQKYPDYKLDPQARTLLTDADPAAADSLLVTGTGTGGGTGAVAGIGANAASSATNSSNTSKADTDEINVTGTGTGGGTAGISGATASTAANAASNTNNNTNNKTDDEIKVTAQTGAGTPGTASLVDAAMNIDPAVEKLIDEQLAKDPENKGLTTKDLIRLGLLTPSLIAALAGGNGDGAYVNVGGGGGIVPIVPLNRTQNVATGGGQAGLGSYGFNPFTYGQAGLGQPEEYLFFGKPTTKSTGAAPAATTAGIGAVPTTAGASADTGGGTTPPGTNPPGTTTTGATNARLTLDVPAGGIGNNAPVILEGGNKGPATPANTGYTAQQLAGRQNYYNLMRDPNIATFTSNINKTIASQLAANKISQEQARGINERLQALYQTPGTTQEAIRGLATTALRDATKAFASTAPAPAVSAVQNPDSASYVAGIGPADVYATTGVKKAEGGEVEDDMVKHLLEYRKGGGHYGPGHVKGIGSGQEDKIPAWLSDGEYVWSAQDVADLGDGSTDEGVRRLDKMRQMVRKRAGRKDVKKIAKPQRGIEDMLKAVGGRV